ncbi:MAG TPA: ImmA/IrrE family metallo-endopeptidase [Methylomirabilota bacterium]|nr:ImmA/IrrE family metallo-endopeptidase [Methylomirabilota bacterium]
MNKQAYKWGDYMPKLPVSDQARIDAEIERIKAATGRRYPDSNLLEIIRSYAPDLEIKEYDFGEYSPFIKGAIKYADGDNPAILINDKRISKSGRNFTLAHEFGHYILHENQEKFRLDLVDYGKGTVETMQESEANYFAASLLMPRGEFEEMLQLTNDTEKIAAYFGVSVPAVEVRKRWLTQNKTR